MSIIVLLLVVIAWVTFGPDRVAQPTRTALSAGIGQAAETAGQAASDRWQAGQADREARRAARHDLWAGQGRWGRMKTNADRKRMAAARAAAGIIAGGWRVAVAGAIAGGSAARDGWRQARADHRTRRDGEGTRLGLITRILRSAALNTAHADRRTRLADAVVDVWRTFRPDYEHPGCCGCGRSTCDYEHVPTGEAYCADCRNERVGAGRDPASYERLPSSDRRPALTAITDEEAAVFYGPPTHTPPAGPVGGDQSPKETRMPAADNGQFTLDIASMTVLRQQAELLADLGELMDQLAVAAEWSKKAPDSLRGFIPGTEAVSALVANVQAAPDPESLTSWRETATNLLRAVEEQISRLEPVRSDGVEGHTDQLASV